MQVMSKYTINVTKYYLIHHGGVTNIAVDASLGAKVVQYTVIIAGTAVLH